MSNFSLNTYYLLKPYLPASLRLALKKSLAKRSVRHRSGSWFINPVASRTPEWFTAWPNGKRFAFVLTHDVEGKKGLSRCRQLAEMDTSLEFHSSFNFIPEGDYETPGSLREFLATKGFEIGVHDLRHDGKLYRSRRHFGNCAKRINRHLAEWQAVGFRSGFMRHDLDWLRDLNVLYDSSTFDTDPFEPQPDGVNTIFPFWVGRSDGSGYVELPYTLPQDSTLFLLLGASSIDIWIRKLDWVAEHGGMALLNVHPDYMSFGGAKSQREYEARLYRDFLEYVAKRYGSEGWFALPREVAAYTKACSLRTDVNTTSPRLGSAPSVYRLDDRTFAETCAPRMPTEQKATDSSDWNLHGKRVAMVMYSIYPNDARPRRAAEALVSKGMRVDLICLKENGKEPKHEIVNGMDVFRVPIKRFRGSIFAYGYQYSAFILASAIILAARSLRRRYDLVYVHNMPDFLVLSALIPKMLGAKLVLDLHDPMPELMMTIFGLQPDELGVRCLQRLEKWSIALADSVVTVNDTCARLFTGRSCPSTKMSVVMNSPDEEIFRPRPSSVGNTASSRLSDRPFVIMYHGSLVERNGLQLAVDALSRIRRSVPSARLRVYGWQNSYLDQVMRSVRTKGLQDVVEYMGPRALDQLVDAMEECDLGIVPNLSSIFTKLNTPIRIFEYLVVGKPVIAPRAPGICDYFADDALLFFELGDAEDLARTIEYAFFHPVEVNEVLRRGQEVYRAHHWGKERLRLISVVARLLSKEASRIDPATRARDAEENVLSGIAAE